jgi:RimJ/RimL family protein N-acetyltransferase
MQHYKLDDTIVEILSPIDAEKIEMLFQKVWPNATEYPIEWRKKRMLNQEQIVLEMNSHYRYFGIKMNNQIIGLYKTHSNGNTIYGEHQTIHPLYRGQGLAIKMYEQLIEFAKEKKIRKIQVNILEDQIASKKCVDKLGFQKKGELWEQSKGMIVQTYQKNL